MEREGWIERGIDRWMGIERVMEGEREGWRERGRPIYFNSINPVHITQIK